MTAYEWERDPKRLAFILARYKFVAKMLEGKQLVLEVGCADGFGSRIVRQTVGSLDAVDIDEASINEAKADSRKSKWGINFFHSDFLKLESAQHDAVFCLDVLEHIHPQDESDFLIRLRHEAPVCIIGTPSAESQAYASELSKQGHINCKSGQELKDLLLNHWSQVFMFGMNDETLHTGFMPMSHYLFALCIR